MSRLIDAFAFLLLLGATASFALGLRALAAEQDLRALYMLVVGALALRGSTEILRPRGSG